MPPFTLLEEVLATMAAERPIFHSEADLQHELAWRYRQARPTACIRLELPARFNHGRASIDMVIHEEATTCFVEIKFKTAHFRTRLHEEDYDLKNHGAKDLGSYDVIKDVCRVESFVRAKPGSCGCVVFITNDPSYWTDTRAKKPIDLDYQLVEGRILQGTLAWQTHAGIGSIRKREEPLVLEHSHPIHWQTYSTLPDQGANHFRYVCFRIPGSTQAAAPPHSPREPDPVKSAAIAVSSRSTDARMPRDQRDAVLLALRALGGSARAAEITAHARAAWNLEIKDCGTVLADMLATSQGGNSSSSVPTHLRILRRIGRGLYGLPDTTH